MIMSQPFVSIITVARNAASLLQKTINNVSQLNGNDFEYIVVDGNSTDNSKQLISQSACIDKWISEPDKGIYDAMNKGARLASGKWVIFMNAGDTFANPYVIDKLKSYAESHPDADVIYGDVIRAGVSIDQDCLKVASDTLKGHRLAFCHQSVICRREDLLKFPFDTTHRYSSDFKFFKTLAANKRVFSHIPLAIARFDTSGISSQRRSSGLADNMRVIMETDGFFKGFPHIMHLLPTYLISRMKGN